MELRLEHQQGKGEVHSNVGPCANLFHLERAHTSRKSVLLRGALRGLDAGAQSLNNRRANT